MNPIEQNYYPEVFRIVAGNATGSGFLLDPSCVDGHVGLGVTNAHVIGQATAPRIYPIYTDNQPFRVNVVALCHEYDLAVFQIPAPAQKAMRAHLAKHGMDALPALRLADARTMHIGQHATSVGHPMGLFRQVINEHHMSAVEPFDGKHDIWYMNGSVNPGNSGGPLLNDDREVMGVVSLKIVAEHVNNLNGVRSSDEINYILPQVLDVLAQERHVLSDMVERQLGQVHAALVAKAAGGPVDAAFEEAWRDHAVGGTVRGMARPFHVWCQRHVLDEDGFLDGGEQLLAHVAGRVRAGEAHLVAEERQAAGGWAELREQLREQLEGRATFQILEVTNPITGIESHPIHTMGEVVHYGHDPADVTGGVRVSSVLPRSLYEQAGGRPGDIIHRVDVDGKSFTFNLRGRSEPGSMGMTLTLSNVLVGAPYGAEVAVHALRPEGARETLHFTIRAPAPEELPHVRQTYSNTATGMSDAQQQLDVHGIRMAALRLQHVARYQIPSFARAEKRYRFHAVVVGVHPESSAHELVREGMIVRAVNGEPVAENLVAFAKQLEAARAAPVFRLEAGHELGAPVCFSVTNAPRATLPPGALAR